MKKNDWRPPIPQPAFACALLIGAWVLTTGSSHAVTAEGIASATVIGSTVVIITVPAPVPAPAAAAAAATVPVSVPVPAPATVETPPALSGTVFTTESFTSSLSTSGPLLRVGTAAPAGAAGSAAQGSGATEGAASAQGSTAVQGSAGAAPPAASASTVSVTRKADGSLAVSGGSGLTFAVSQPVNGAVSIEYN